MDATINMFEDVFSCTSVKGIWVTSSSSLWLQQAPLSVLWGKRDGTNVYEWQLRCKVCTKPGKKTTTHIALDQGHVKCSQGWLNGKKAL